FGGVNRGFYLNEEVDKLINEAYKAKEVEDRDRIIKEVWQIASDDVAYIPIHFEQDLFATNSRINYTPRISKYVYAWDIEVIK
ncbi:MAG: ABC transporter substrate-binding protein, partial [Tissierellia bacterium]|nr:ABC transporter substrate-binding protein [Tissierellia bacterium]